MNPQDLINKSTRYVTATLAEHGIEYRTVQVGGVKLPVEGEPNPQRLNLSFRNDRLVAYTYG